MDILVIVNNVIRFFFFSLYTFYILKKILNLKETQEAEIKVCVASSVSLGIVYAMLFPLLNTFPLMIFTILMIALITHLITKIKPLHSIFLAALAMGMNLLFFNTILVVVSVFIALSPLLYIHESPLLQMVALLIAFIIECFVINLFFKIRRFKERICFC